MKSSNRSHPWLFSIAPALALACALPAGPIVPTADAQASPRAADPRPTAQSMALGDDGPEPDGNASAAADRKEKDRRLYVGMWTLHFRELDRGLENNWVVGVSWGSVYGATFINSFGKRAYSAGLQGSLARWDTSPVTLGLGYRAGVITGYDERFIPLAGQIPVLPLVQPLLHLDGRRVGLELSYAGIIASAAVNVRF